MQSGQSVLRDMDGRIDALRAQGVNVLCGDMSWIGPRPLTLADVQRLRWTGAEHDPRFQIRPGLLDGCFAGR